MELKWIEDFIVLAQVKSFSKAAQLRNVTQPAFSRRVQSLELWLGAALIDRSCFPLELTEAGIYFKEQSNILLETIFNIRKTVKISSASQGLVIDFAAPHNLSLTFFPHWIKNVSKHFGGAAYKLKALNLHDAIISLLNGSSNLLIAYSHPCAPLQLDTIQYDSKLLGTERMFLYGPTSLKEEVARNPNLEIPFLAYGAGAYLGKIADYIITQSDLPINLKIIYETDMAEGLKSMVLAGHGYAFLPESSVKKEFDQGAIFKAFPCEGYLLGAELEIRLFRSIDKSVLMAKEGFANFDRCCNQKQNLISNLWSYL